MSSTLSSGQLTLTDLNDAIVAGTAPSNPTANQLWVDTSVTPNLLKKWSGSAWTTMGEVASTGTSATATNNNTTLGNMANDNIIDVTERQDVKDKLTAILGFAIYNGTTTLPTTATLDSGSTTDNSVSVSTKGTFYTARKSATNAGLSTSDTNYTNLATQYTNLKTYLEGLTPIDCWDVSSANQASNITVVKDTWRTNWLNYYLAEQALDQAVALKLKQNVDNVTISGRNMLRNTGLETDANYFAPSTGVTRDTSKTDGTEYTFKWVITGKSSDLWSADNPSQIACKAGDIVSASVDIYIPTGHGIDYSVPTLEIQWFNSSGSRITANTKGSDLTLLDQWQRVKLENITAPSGAVNCNARVWLQRNGSFWDGKLKLEWGSKATDWTPALEDNSNTIYNTVFNVNKQNIISTVTKSSDFNTALTTGQGDFIFNNGGASWVTAQGGSTPITTTIVHDAIYGANSIQLSGTQWVYFGTPIPIDTARVYQVKFRVKQTTDPTSGGSNVYAGVASFDANKANLTASTFGTHRYCATAGTTINVSKGWQEYTGKISGEGDGGFDQFITGTKYAVPMFIVNYSGGNGVALVDICSLEDITDVDSLGTRVGNVEQSLSADGITTIITQSTFYQNYKDDLKGKADGTDLGKYALGTALDTTNSNLSDLSTKVDGIDLTKYATTDYVDETSTHLTTKFSASGGMNLLKNSIGFSDFITKAIADLGTKNWFIQGSVTNSANRVTAIQTTELDTLGFGSGFQWQGVPITPSTAPTLALVANAGSTLTATTHYVKYTWVSATGESIPSPEANLAVTSGNNLKVTIPAFPTGVTSANIYVSTTSGSEKYQNVISTSAGNIQFSAPVATNTTAIAPYQNASIDQYVNVIPNQTYTLSWYVSKTNASSSANDDGALRFFLYEYGQSTQINVSYPSSTNPTNMITGTEYKYTSDAITNGYDIKYITFTPATNKVQLRIYGHSMFSGTVTGLMFTIGDVALQWSLATGESFNTNVRLDINGIRVSQLQTNADGSETEVGYTSITPSEFAGWYDTDGNGTFEKVFYLNGDETVTKKLTATDEITMGSVKIINVTTGGYNGWAFVPSS